MLKSIAGFKIEKETKTNFTKVPNEIFSLPLDPYQKLILIYLHSKSDDFVHYHLFIGKTLGISRQTVSKCFKDLIELGYLLSKDNGKTYSLMLTALTPDVNHVNTGHVNMPTVDVKMPTQDVDKLTRDVNHVNTTKKTDIQRLNNKTENSPVSEPTPLRVPVPNGESRKNNLNDKEEKMNKKVIEIVNGFTDEQIVAFEKLNTNSKEVLISKFNLIYEDELSLKILLNKRLSSITYNTSTKKIIDLKQNKEVTPSTVQDGIPTTSIPAFGGESSAQINSGVIENYDMFDVIQNWK